jgi:hypothetical protein
MSRNYDLRELEPRRLLKESYCLNKKGDICMEISKGCLESYPCQHEISINMYKPMRMYGDKIYIILRSSGFEDIDIPEHFRSYKNEIVRKMKEGKLF